MRHTNDLQRLDPVDMSAVERVSSNPIFEELRRDIMVTSHIGEPLGDASSLRLHRRARLLVGTVIAVAAMVAVIAGLFAFDGGSNAPKSPAVTAQRAGTWRLADDVLSGTWQQYADGPPPGVLSCPTTSTCYAMSGHYASDKGGAPLLSLSLYVSNDAGATWSERPMPHGFAPTSPVACGGSTNCAVGGVDNGRNVLVTTTDGGDSFAIDPLPVGVGHLDTLSCPSADYCAGLAASSEILGINGTNAAFLSTSNGGASFTDRPIVTGDSMQSLTCSSNLDCTTVGWNNALGPNDLTAGVAAHSTDGGRTWTAASLPEGFGISSDSHLSCADALHCSVTGLIDITVQNPPQCSSMPQGGGGTPLPASPQSPAVKAISQMESEVATNANLKSAQSGVGGFSCNPNGTSLISDIASTVDGGRSWTPDPLPTDVPEPMLFGLSCPTDGQCWAAGSDAVPEQVGSVSNGGSPVVLGTTDGGATWSAVTFTAPKDATNYAGQAYLTMGWIACPSAGDCVALGTGAQSSPSVPVYSLMTPESS
jgi:hypothetical protein